jgi:tetraprenyl-beta-curcumene synthase
LTPGQSARAGGALVIANARYWTGVAPLVRARLSRWEGRAQAIPDPALKALATEKLREERFNVEVAATLATLAPRARRASTVEAIVALQVMYDYLDLLTEQPLTEQPLTEQPLPDPPLPDPPADARCLFAAFTDALTPGEHSDGDYYRHHPQSRDGGYLRELVRAVRLSLAKLPAAEAVGEVALHSAKRCADAQALSHAAAHSGTAELERWARREATGGGWAPQDGGQADLQWLEFLAGAAASVLAVHALIAAAADPRTTSRDAEEIDAVYLSICALTMLDSLVDHEHDIATGELNYIELYESHELMATRLASLTRDAASKARALPGAAHHTMMLVGVVAYYASAPAASSAFAQSVVAGVREELRPLMTPTLAVMRVWRLAKRTRARWP